MGQVVRQLLGGFLDLHLLYIPVPIQGKTYIACSNEELQSTTDTQKISILRSIPKMSGKLIQSWVDNVQSGDSIDYVMVIDHMLKH